MPPEEIMRMLRSMSGRGLSLKFWFNSNGCYISFFKDSAISTVCKGIQPVEFCSGRENVTSYCRFYHTCNGKRVFPVLPIDRCLFTAFVVAFTCLFRCSEYVGKFALLVNDIAFEVSVKGVSMVIPAYDVHTRVILSTQVSGVIINNRREKADKSGESFRYHFAKKVPSDLVAFDVTSVLFDWAIFARLKKNDMFLSYRGQWCFSYSNVQKAVRKVANSLSLDPVRYTSHSFRVGGASVLATGGTPDYIIMKMGHWKSLAFLDYIRESTSFFDIALSKLNNPSLLTLEHLKRFNSGMRLV